MAKARLGWWLAGLLLLPSSPASANAALTARIDAYLQPLVDSAKFSGAVLVTQDGSVVFDKAYGLADPAHQVPNQTTTSFHIGTLSRAYTAAAAEILIGQQKLFAGNTVEQFIPGLPNGDRITIADLLASDTPQAYNLLAHVIAANTAKPFADILDTDFFGPLFMSGSGLDGGDMAPERRMAVGLTADGAPVSAAWEHLMGQGAVYATTRDELRWVEAFFGDRLMPAAQREALLAPAGPGWVPADTVLGTPGWAMAGQAPGFASFVIHLPAKDVTVVMLGNVESGDAVRKAGIGLAALALEQAPPP